MRRLVIISTLGLLLLTLPGQAGAVSLKTTRFVASFEGFSSCVYADPAGHATIGYGHLLHLGPPTKKDRKRWGCLSKAGGLRLLKKDLRSTEIGVYGQIRNATVTPPMVTALTSFSFNLGTGTLGRTKRNGKPRVTNIALHVRQGRYRLAAREMLLYDGVIVNGKRRELEGLRIRRRKEYRLMIKGIGQLRSCGGKCPTGGSPGGIAIR